MKVLLGILILLVVLWLICGVIVASWMSNEEDFERIKKMIEEEKLCEKEEKEE